MTKIEKGADFRRRLRLTGCAVGWSGWTGLVASMLAGTTLLQAGAPLFQDDFETRELNSIPDDYLVLAGAFAVKEVEGRRFLELPGAPLESFGLVFGPSAREGQWVAAQIYGTRKGRRYPAFGISAGGVGGYKLQVTPAKRALELFRYDTQVAEVPFDWQSGSWTQLNLQIRKVSDAKWRVEGKVWRVGETEPAVWTLTHETDEQPVQGQPGVWGSPFSGTPIRFDNLEVRTAQPSPRTERTPNLEHGTLNAERS